MPGMETLGLSGPPQPRDSFFRRLFWPSDNASDADTLAQQGFWLCFAIGVLSLVVQSLQGHWIIGVLTALIFTLGGAGVREHDLFAAISVAVMYITNIVALLTIAILFHGQPPGILSFFAALLLLGNIRAGRISAKWARLDPESVPLRMNETWQDKLADQMPARIWPKTKYVYYVVATAFYLLSLAGMIIVISRAHH